MFVESSNLSELNLLRQFCNNSNIKISYIISDIIHINYINHMEPEHSQPYNNPTTEQKPQYQFYMNNDVSSLVMLKHLPSMLPLFK